MKKDISKWCNFYKSPWHKTDECRTKQSLVAEMKSSELDPDFNSNSEMDKGKHIIDVAPSAIVATTHIQPEDLDEPEEGQRLFHSQMWVNGVSLHFIVDNGSKRT